MGGGGLQPPGLHWCGAGLDGQYVFSVPCPLFPHAFRSTGAPVVALGGHVQLSPLLSLLRRPRSVSAVALSAAVSANSHSSSGSS
eukprot:COSAG03_NODE_5951_length_1143_cov_1.778736_1_plen_84_part_10